MKKVADAEDKPSQATTDSQAEQPAQEAQPASVSEAIQNGSVENSSKENIPATPAKQARTSKYRNQKTITNSCLQELVSSLF